MPNCVCEARFQARKCFCSLTFCNCLTFKLPVRIHSSLISFLMALYWTYSGDGTTVERSPPTAVSQVRFLGYRCRVWVEVVVDFRPCSEGFSPGPLVFLLTQKPIFQFPIRDSSGLEKPPRGMSTANSHYDQFRGFFF